MSRRLDASAFDVGAYLAARCAAGYPSDAALARTLGIGRGELAEIIRGVDPGALLRVRLARVLGVAIEDLWPAAAGRERRA